MKQTTTYPELSKSEIGKYAWYFDKPLPKLKPMKQYSFNISSFRGIGFSFWKDVYGPEWERIVKVTYNIVFLFWKIQISIK